MEASPGCRAPIPMNDRPAVPRPALAVLRRCFVAVLLVLTVATSTSPVTAQDGPSGPGGEGTPLKADYDEVLGAEAELNAAIDESAARRVAIVQQIAALDQQLFGAAIRLEAAEAALVTARRAEAAARSALAAARRRVARATDAFNAQTVSSYMYGGTSDDAIGALLESYEDGTAAARTLSYADAVSEHQRTVLRELKAARAERDRATRRSVAARNGATGARDAIATLHGELQRNRLRVQQLSIDATREFLLQAAALTELRSKKLEIEARIVTLEKESDGIALTLFAIQADQPDYVAGSIAFTPPLPGARFSSPFGQRIHPILNYQRLHAGVDLGASTGEPILATADGVVAIAAVRGGYGNCVVIDHGSAIASLYGHQSRMLVRPGQRVKAGDVIGEVGSTGLSTGPHLHFETRFRGIPVNPLNFVALEGAPGGPPAGG